MAKVAGARYIVGVDVNERKYEAAKKFGADECVNPTVCDNGDVKAWLLGRKERKVCARAFCLKKLHFS